MTKEVHDVIVQLLDCLPDSQHNDDESWEWGWDELDGDAQEQVKAARKAANELLRACYASGLFTREEPM